MTLVGANHPNAAAQARQAAKTAVPSELTSAQWRGIAPQIRERAMIISRCTIAELFEQTAKDIEQMASGVSPGPGQYTNLATARVKAREALAKVGYKPAEGEEGTITDLSSEGRLNLMLETNTQQVQSYAQTVQSLDPEVVDQYPCWEYYRLEDREDPRDWDGPNGRWMQAAHAAGDTRAARCLQEYGRMVARKDSPIWEYLGSMWDDSLDTDYPPYAFRSGMWREEVDRQDAEDIGAIELEQKIKPHAMPGLNDGLEVAAPTDAPGLRSALLSQLGPDWHFVGDILRRVTE